MPRTVREGRHNLLSLDVAHKSAPTTSSRVREWLRPEAARCTLHRLEWVRVHLAVFSFNLVPRRPIVRGTRSLSILINDTLKSYFVELKDRFSSAEHYRLWVRA